MPRSKTTTKRLARSRAQPRLALADFLNAVEAEAGEPLGSILYVAGQLPRFTLRNGGAFYLGAESTAREVGLEIRRRRAEEGGAS